MIRIAVAEDQETERERLLCYLKRYQHDRNCPFEVDIYADGAELISAYQPGVDILLLDIEMPVMDAVQPVLPRESALCDRRGQRDGVCGKRAAPHQPRKEKGSDEGIVGVCGQDLKHRRKASRPQPEGGFSVGASWAGIETD